MTGDRCELCGSSSDVGRGMVRWRDPQPGALFDSIVRCVDVAACRKRCEAGGDIWPVDDGTPATRRAIEVEAS